MPSFNSRAINSSLAASNNPHANTSNPTLRRLQAESIKKGFKTEPACDPFAICYDDYYKTYDEPQDSMSSECDPNFVCRNGYYEPQNPIKLSPPTNEEVDDAKKNVERRSTALLSYVSIFQSPEGTIFEASSDRIKIVALAMATLDKKYNFKHSNHTIAPTKPLYLNVQWCYPDQSNRGYFGKLALATFDEELITPTALINDIDTICAPNKYDNSDFLETVGISAAVITAICLLCCVASYFETRRESHQRQVDEEALIAAAPEVGRLRR